MRTPIGDLNRLFKQMHEPDEYHLAPYDLNHAIYWIWVLKNSYIKDLPLELRHLVKEHARFDVFVNGQFIGPNDYIVEQFYTQASSSHRIKNLRNYLSNLSTDRILRSIVPLGRIIFGRADRLSFLEKINAPSLIITGEQDKPRPPQEGEQMAKILGCKHKIVKNAGHISNQEQPEIITNILLDFLKQHLN